MSARTANRLYRRNRAIVLSKNQVCWICGFKIDLDLKAPDDGSATVDHIIPHSKGGDDSVENLRPAHMGCNRKRRSKDFNQLDVRKSGGVEW